MIRIAKVRILGDPFGAIFDAFLSHFWVVNFQPQKWHFLVRFGIQNWFQKLVQNASKIETLKCR